MEFVLLVGLVFTFLFLQKGRNKLKRDLDALSGRVAKLESMGLKVEAAPTPVKPVEIQEKKEGIPEKRIEVEIPEALPVQEAVWPAVPAVPPPPPPPPPPSIPRPPNPLFQAIKHFFTGGNLVVRLGVIVLFFGVSFLLKLAIDQGLIPIEVRLSGVALIAIVFLVLGWRLREKRTGFALNLLGGAIGVLYLDVFAAFRIYQLLPPQLAFFLLLLIVLFSSLIAVRLKSQALAVLGVCGGFLAPILASTGHGSHVQLFTYFLILNLGIVAIAWFRAWRVLNLLGFLFTFVLSLTWGLTDYQPAYFSSTEPFLILFFLFYSLIPILFALKTQTFQKGFVDTTLSFGTPIIAFSLQAALVKEIPNGLAWSALTVAAYYLVIAWLLMKKAPDTLKALREVFLAIGVVFVTLTLPLRLDHQWTSLSWALEGAALVWVGVRQKRILARLFGVLILFSAGIAYREATGERGTIILNPYFFGAFFISLGSFFASYYLSLHRDLIKKFERIIIIVPLFLWALGWWFYAAYDEILSRLPQGIGDIAVTHVVLSVVIFSAGLFLFFSQKLKWPLLQKPLLFFLPVLVSFFIAILWDRSSMYAPFSSYGFLLWPLGLAVHLWYLKINDSETLGFYFKLLHAGWLLLFTALLLKETLWIHFHYFAEPIYSNNEMETGSLAFLETWGSFSAGLFPVLIFFLLGSYPKKWSWPFAKHSGTYLYWGLAPLALYLIFWLGHSFDVSGETLFIPYIPLFNPLELLQAFLFLGLIHWIKNTNWALKTPLKFLVGVLIFFWITILLARSVSHWSNIPYEHNALMDSLLFQTSLTIYWTLLAMGLMIFGTKKKWRSSWVIGVTLLGITVLKMFLIDLSKTQTLARVVSFIGAGLLILLIGYLSPLPPKIKPQGENQ